MTRHQKPGLVIGQIFIGFGSALAGAIIVSIIVCICSGMSEVQMSFYGEIMYALIGGYVGMQVGIGFDGFKYLKRNGRQNDFPGFLGQSCIGLISGLLLFYLYLKWETIVLML